MDIFLGVLFFLVAFFMICAILLQEGKGGGLAAMGGAATDSVMGARNPLRRITAYSFVFFVLIVVALNFTHNRQANKQIGGGLTAKSAATEDFLPADPEQLPISIDDAADSITGTTVNTLERTTSAAPNSSGSSANNSAAVDAALPEMPIVPSSNPATSK